MLRLSMCESTDWRERESELPYWVNVSEIAMIEAYR
jgi:hypothetical protein